MSDRSSLPKYDELFQITLQVISKLGGSASIEELDDAVLEAIGATPEQLDVTYTKSGAAILPDRLSWARSWLKTPGFLANPRRGVWVLTEEGRAAADKSNSDLKRIVNEAYRAQTSARKATAEAGGEPPGDKAEGAVTWADQLLARVQAIEPAAFERLCQRIMRESGFVRVEVSGKSGDGGIDGVGVLRMNLISFQVLFQCKRWKGSVGSETVRNFRGAMQGRADKGLIITTGTFTSEARKEATRDGAPAIDLIDGEALCLLMRDLELGVRVQKIETMDVTLDTDFFSSI